jgi:tRNA A37 N6-isopentenylltransferase MiaA
VPIVVGGCGFYLSWYLHKTSRPDHTTKAPPEVVRKIKKVIDDDQGDWYRRCVPRPPTE